MVSTKLLSSLFDLTAANPFLKQPSELAVWKHTLSNIGSVNDSYKLSLTQATNDNGDLLNPIIVEDTNGNGIYDPAIDTVVSQVSLNINKQTTLFVVGTVPANAKPNDVFNTISIISANIGIRLFFQSYFLISFRRKDFILRAIKSGCDLKSGCDSKSRSDY